MRPGWEDVFTVKTKRKKKDDATGKKKKDVTKGKRRHDKDTEEDDKDQGRGDKKDEQDVAKDDEEGGNAQQWARHRKRRLSAYEDGEIIPPGIKFVHGDCVTVGLYAPQVCLVDTGYGLGHRDLPHEKGRTIMGRSPEDTDDGEN